MVVVAGEDDVRAPGGKRAPEWCDCRVGAVKTGAEARVVHVGDRAAARVGGEVAGEPALLRRARGASACGPAIRVDDDDMPAAELVGVVAPAGEPEVRDRGVGFPGA